MSWLAPLGFLGLIGVIALIVIYIIRPNYQQKIISSTYVWRLSLKYRKKRLPINRLNNFLIFLCQLLMLSICGSLLAQPVLETQLMGDENEKVIILEASANMLVSNGKNTRFERAVTRVEDLVKETASAGGVVTVIYADANPTFLVQRATADQMEDSLAKLNELVSGELNCPYSSADLEKAVSLAEEVLRYNSEAQVYLCGGTDYLEKNGIQVENLADPKNEWNVAVLGAYAELDDTNHYMITVDLGCYGSSEQVTVYCEIHGANGKSVKVDPLIKSEFFDPTAEEKTIVFTSDDMNGEPLYSFDYLEVYVSVDDSFHNDNSFFVYGGKPQTIKVQYASSIPNNYFSGILRTIRENMKEQWNIELKILKADQKAATEGFDLYIFEHRMPDVMPTDGVVLLVDPASAPEGSGIYLGKTLAVESSSTLAAGTPHVLTKYVDSSRITIAKYREILSFEGYQELAYYNGMPMILVRETPESKVVVWAYDLNYSNLCAMPDFSFMIYNLFNYFIPATMPSVSFEIGDTVQLTARGTELKVTGNGEELSFEGSKGELVVTRPGTYTVTQKPMNGDQLIIENFFVKIPTEESNITKKVDSLPIMDVDTELEQAYEDLLFYFAIALVVLLFAEWFLQSKKNI